MVLRPHTRRPPTRRLTIDELTSERAYVDAAYARLEELRAKATQLAAEAHWRDEDYVVDSLFERDVVANQAAHRIAALDVPKSRMAVGRIDREDGDRWYIGRLAIAEETVRAVVRLDAARIQGDADAGADALAERAGGDVHEGQPRRRMPL